MDDNFDTVNATDWKANVEGEHSHHGPALQSWIKKSNAIEMKSTVQSPTAERSSTKTPEIDFYNAETESYSEDSKNQEIIPEDTSNRNVNLPIQPIFPTHISPEIQYGNEKADDEKRRTPKLFLSEVLDPDDTSENPSKPHITQKPEKPLAIYFQHDENLGSREVINLSDNLNETNENNFEEKIVENDGNRNNYLDPNSLKKDHYQILPKTSNEAEVQSPVKADVKFTSGHSKLFGISIEDAAKMQSTTPNSVYNTRVSPTLPVLRDLEDATAKYPMNVNNDGQPQCRSTRLALCRGVLPYDLASAAVTPGGIEITSLVAQLEHLIATNCSNRVQQFACALLEPECSPPPYPPRLPCYHLCTAISEDCEGLIPHDLQPVFQCNLYPRNNCVTAHSPCNPEEFQCSDGTCILKSNVCDGRFDCPAGNDEESCTNCRSDEFSCPSGGCVVRRWVCDGYTDCPNGEDESEAACASEAAARLLVGEQSEASDPAPARLPHPLQLRRPGDSDELLMTSDSGNAYRRNYTRPRPSPSRLTPYSRKLPQNAGEKLSLINDVTKTTMSSGNGPSSINNSPPDARPSVLRRIPCAAKRQDEWSRFMPDSPAEESSTKSTERSPIDNSKVMTEGEELFMLDDVGLVSAHASPCPSSELRCVDGRCITLAQLCDGTIDCSDHADEENCYT
ncbi:Very low-density lipoprotein receptor [Eumeta japonica]|uniref:Very low-density lipoprotein receptor n=1 Tax=Eumeta variegata TaxID=151549 RepID=A0A4C1TCA3_EUMVA|nr:Very low-density lipoprotein receptor [Eumeta japonica]